MPPVNGPHVRSLIQHFADLPDPRATTNRRHLLVDVIVIAICAIIANADGPVAIEEWAKAHEAWLKKYLRLPSGIPSHDTIGRVLSVLQPQSFQECFTAWLLSLEEVGDEEQADPLDRHIAIDGKTLRRSHSRGQGLGPLHVVSAWATKRGITLGQVATEEKSNEITAIPELLERLDLNGAVVTIDAAGCQKNIAAQIIAGGGDYVLALKGNQETLFRAVETYFDEQVQNDFQNVRVIQWGEVEKGHGREEHRHYYQMPIPDDLPGREKWRGLRTLGVAMRICKVGDKQTVETRFYICSLPLGVKRFAGYVRGHWGIENTLHWCLDMTFREDESRARKRLLADNLAWIRKFALTLLKQHPANKSIASKRRIAGWDVSFLMEILMGKAK